MVDIRHFDYDEEVSRLLARAEFDFNAAAELLVLFAEYLRSEKPMPGALVHHVAGAIESSMTKRTSKDRLIQLGRELKLSAQNSRKKGDPYVIARMFEEAQKSNPSKSDTQVAKLVADKYKRDYKLKTMTPTTVIERRNEYLDACKPPN